MPFRMLSFILYLWCTNAVDDQLCCHPFNWILHFHEVPVKSWLRVPPAAPLILHWTSCSVVVFGNSAFGRFNVYATKRDLEDFKVVSFCVLNGEDVHGSSSRLYSILHTLTVSLVWFVLLCLNDAYEVAVMFWTGFGGLC